MQQVIDVTMPPSLTSTVRDALHYVLIRSGYQLCDRDDNRVFGTLPLPAAHMRLGPMTLRNVLQVLVGPAWLPEVDDMARQVCFHQNPAQSRDASKGVAPNLDSSAADAVTTATVSQPER
jgi:conjugative transfer region protein (TIGR03748 family)